MDGVVPAGRIFIRKRKLPAALGESLVDMLSDVSSTLTAFTTTWKKRGLILSFFVKK